MRQPLLHSIISKYEVQTETVFRSDVHLTVCNRSFSTRSRD